MWILGMVFSIIAIFIKIIICLIGLAIAIPLLFIVSLLCAVISGVLIWCVGNTICKWFSIDLGEKIADGIEEVLDAYDGWVEGRKKDDEASSCS